jgi:hypothetical protein
MEYPHFRQHLSNGNRIEFFSLTSDERFLLSQWRTDTNILGFAILLKSYQYLGYPPRNKEDVPDSVISFVSQQLKLDAALFDQYRWKDSVWRVHLTSIRDHNKFRPGSKEDFQRLGQWLIEEADCHPTRSKMYTAAIQRYRSLRIELPSEKELQRLVSSAWKQYLSQACQAITDRIKPSIRKKMDLCLDVDPKDKERFGWMKAKPGKVGIKTLLREVRRLHFVNGFEIQPDAHLTEIPKDVLKLLRERAVPEDAYQMKRHRPAYRYALMAVLLHFRQMELTDIIIDTFLALIRRIQKKADTKMEKDLIGSIKTVYKKREILYLLAKASIQNPRNSVERALFPIVGEEILYRIIEEYEGQDLSYDNTLNVERKNKYTRSYRRMVKPVLDTLVFRATNPGRRSLMAGVDLVHKYLDKKHTCYPETEDLPMDLLSGIPEELWAKEDRHGTLVLKHYFELCVLQKLEKALKNKEVWVEGSYRYRNPDEDLPSDWAQCWVGYCDKHRIPETADEFLNPIKMGFLAQRPEKG